MPLGVSSGTSSTDGPPDPLVFSSSLAMLRTWAADSGFPRDWSSAAFDKFNAALAQCPEPFRRACSGLVLGWAHEALAPLSIALGDCPTIGNVMGLLEALREG